MSEHPEWIRWQREHSAALQVLQEAQRLYHRVRSDHAFGVEDEAAADKQKETLRLLDEARLHLDRIRARQPR